jgi:hypothetical protein
MGDGHAQIMRLDSTTVCRPRSLILRIAWKGGRGYPTLKGNNEFKNFGVPW